MFFTGALTSILRTNLRIKKNETLLIFTDTPSDISSSQEEKRKREMIKEVALALVELGEKLAERVIYHEYPETLRHGSEPPKGLWKKAFGERIINRFKEERIMRKLLTKKADEKDIHIAERIIRRYSKDVVDAVIALSKYSTSHTAFRDLLTRVKGTRYASMPLFEPWMLESSMNVDWKVLEKRTKKVASLLKGGRDVVINTPNGTDIRFSIKGRKVFTDTGILTKKGSFGNLPAGEVFLAPLEGSADGQIVIEWAPTRRLNSGLILRVEKGMVKDVIGEEPFKDELMKALRMNPLNSNIAELGIGTNDMASKPDNILESEKILGTVHIALGDNSSFGGNVRTPFHQDFVLFRPTLRIIYNDGSERTLLKDGKLKVEVK